MKKTFLLLIHVLIIVLGACVPAADNTPATGFFDPNLESIRAQQTSDAKAGEAQLLSVMATGTAQAPILAITQRAADLIVEQTEVSMRQTEIAVSWTSTPSATPTITSSPTRDATMTAVFDQLLLEQHDIQMKIERDQTNNQMRAVAGYAILFIASIIGVLYAFVGLKRLSFIPNPVDERGKPMPMIEVINAVSWDIDRSTNGVVGATQKFLKSLPVITAERQDLVTERAQMVDMQTRIQRVPKRLLESQSMKFLSAPAAEDQEEHADMHDADLLLPDWNVINGWDGQSRPLGLGRKGIIVAQAASPHLLTTGGTGSGKTAFMLRTQATASLAKGYQVINLGFSDSGFGVFADHPNYHSIKLSQSSDVIDCLASVYKELKERKQIIGGESIEWEHWRAGELPPRPFVDVLIDELGNLADDIYTSEETSKEGAVKTMQLWRWMSMIAKEGRKVGIRFLAALQDPTAKSVNLSFRRNCTLVSFQLGDASQSRSFIGVAGAEMLQVGHFMTRNFSGNEGVIVGGGFAPTDDEIKAYLRLHPAPQTPAPTWIEGTLVNQPTLAGSEPIRLSAPAPTGPAVNVSRTDFVNGLHEWQVRVLDLYEAGLDKTAILEIVFEPQEYQVGRVAIDDLIQRWQVVKGAAPASSQPVPVAFEQTMQDPEADIDAQIRSLHAQGISNTNIVYKIWDKSSAEFSDRMARVKRVLATASASEARETPENEPVAA